MIYYSFHPQTGEYLGEITAPENPRVPGEFLKPAFAAADAPPEAGAGEAACWNGADWELVSDNRGTVYWTADGQRRVMSALGPLPEGALDSAPPPGLEDVRRQELAALATDFEAARLTRALLTPASEWGAVAAGLDHVVLQKRSAIQNAATIDDVRAVRATLSWDPVLPGAG